MADLFCMLKHSELTLDVSLFVPHENFFHPKLGNLQKVPRESVHIYTALSNRNMKALYARLTSTPRQFLGWRTATEVFSEEKLKLR
nr:hypothetical protein [Cognatishimia maritima]